MHISDYIAQYSEYVKPLIDHLIKHKVNHWDTVIRELTAKTFNLLTKRDPAYIAQNILPNLFEMTNSIDINVRHGAVLAAGEIVLALSELEKSENKIEQYLSRDIVKMVEELVQKFLNRDQFRGSYQLQIF